MYYVYMYYVYYVYNIIGDVLKYLLIKMSNPNYLSIIELSIKEPQNLTAEDSFSSLNYSQSLKKLFILLF